MSFLSCSFEDSGQSESVSGKHIAAGSVKRPRNLSTTNYTQVQSQKRLRIGRVLGGKTIATDFHELVVMTMCIAYTYVTSG